MLSILSSVSCSDDFDDEDDFAFAEQSGPMRDDWSYAFGGGPAENVVAFPTGQPRPQPAAAEFRILGMTRSKTYVFSAGRGGVTDGHFRTYSETQLSESCLLALAPLAYWAARFGNENEKTGKVRIDWLAAKDYILGEAARVGWFDPKKVRGRGVWLDREHIVVNAGDALVIDGVRMTHSDPRARKLASIYEADEPLGIAYDAQPMSADESADVHDVVSRFSWARPVDTELVAGWIFAAMICGCLPWRPHLWIVGERGSGKSTVLNNVVSEMLRAVGDTFFIGSSTEAGIRQTLKGDALPAAFDEPESTDKEGAKRVQKVLEFLRVAASEQRGKLSKGSPSGNSIQYEARAMFALASIIATVKQTSDESRIVKVTLKKREVNESTSDAWEGLQVKIAAVFSPENAARFAVRGHRLARPFLRTAETMRRILSSHFNDKRDGDVYGVLAAGAWHVARDDELTDVEKARDFLRERGFFEIEASSVRAETDEEKCLAVLLDMPIEVSWDADAVEGRVVLRRETHSVARWLDQLHAGGGEGNYKVRAWTALRYAGLILGFELPDGRIEAATADDMLRFGEKEIFLTNPRQDATPVLLVCTNHPRICAHFEGSGYPQWATGYGDQLARAGGRYAGAPIRFGGKQSRPVWIHYGWAKK